MNLKWICDLSFFVYDLWLFLNLNLRLYVATNASAKMANVLQAWVEKITG